MRYGVLDVEKNPAEQGYRAQDFDVVVAANVLHATRDVRESIKRIMSLLAPGGILLVYEVTSPPAWFDISISLIEGWQLFNDGLRLDSPLLGCGQWTELLRAAGFADVQAYPEAHSAAEVLGAHIFMARMPGAQGARQLAGADAFKEDFAARSLRPAQTGSNGAALAAQALEFLQSLREAADAERREMLIEYVRGHVARVLRREESDPIERRQRLMDLGIDSLMAVQLRNLLGSRVGLETASAGNPDL